MKRWTSQYCQTHDLWFHFALVFLNMPCRISIATLLHHLRSRWTFFYSLRHRRDAPKPRRPFLSTRLPTARESNEQTHSTMYLITRNTKQRCYTLFFIFFFFAKFLSLWLWSWSNKESCSRLVEDGSWSWRSAPFSEEKASCWERLFLWKTSCLSSGSIRTPIRVRTFGWFKRR